VAGQSWRGSCGAFACLKSPAIVCRAHFWLPCVVMLAEHVSSTAVSSCGARGQKCV